MALHRMGLVKTSLVDFPGRVAATLFTYGCNLRCPYCHNANLVVGEIPPDFLSREEILAFLKRRRAVLDGVAISGGEPLLHADMPAFIAELRELGFAVKVDTNGTLPERLEELDADYVAMDLKMAPEHYGRLGVAETAAKSASVPERLHRSLRTLRRRHAEQGLSYELRTTVVPGLVHEDDIGRIADMLVPHERIVLAPFRGGTTLDPSYEAGASPPPELMASYAMMLRRSGAEVHVREN